MTKNTRRDFLLATAGVWVGSAAGLGQERSPNAKLNIGLIGVGGRGAQNMVAPITNENIVAICDVDELSLAKAATKFPRAKQFRDFRKMIDEGKDLDAVVISTPHHTHAPATARALKAGKHGYCEKPAVKQRRNGTDFAAD
jgi:predicted dehydrogenase